MERDLKEIGADGFSIELELPKDFVLPNYNFTNYHVAVESSDGNYNGTQKDFDNPMALSFGGQKEVDGLVTGLEDFQLSLNKINENLTEVTYSGKLDAGTTNLNHIIYRASGWNSGAILDYILLPEDINSDGSFSITNNNHLLPGNLTPSQLSEQELVIVASDGSVIGYKPDAVTGNFVEVPNGFTNNYSTYNFTEDFYGLAERPDYESLSKTLNISSLYAFAR